MVAKLKQTISDNNIDAEIYGRPKHIYSIWKKMTAKQRDFHELFDVRAVRIVVGSVADCYVMLGLVHGLWRHGSLAVPYEPSHGISDKGEAPAGEPQTLFAEKRVRAEGC